MIDGKDNIWELIKRADLKIENIYKYPESIVSIVKHKSGFDTNDNLLNIEIKDDISENNMYTTSDIDISKNSDINISSIIKDS